MAQPNSKGIRSKQKGLLRYIVSTDADTAARDFGVSTNALKRFVNAKPETAAKSDRFNKLKSVDPVEVARSKQVKLINPLSGKRLSKAYQDYRGNEELTKQVRYAQATRETRRAIENGKVVRKPVSNKRQKVARKQILNNLGGTTAASIMEQYHQGILEESEARSMLADLFANSDATGSQDYFDDHD